MFIYKMDSITINTPTYPKYPEIIKQANIRYLLSLAEVKKCMKKLCEIQVNNLNIYNLDY